MGVAVAPVTGAPTVVAIEMAGLVHVSVGHGSSVVHGVAAGKRQHPPAACDVWHIVRGSGVTLVSCGVIWCTGGGGVGAHPVMGSLSPPNRETQVSRHISRISLFSCAILRLTKGVPCRPNVKN